MVFIVEGYIERTDKFDEAENQFVECEPYYYNPLGSDYCQIIHDLKTLRGVKNRISKWRWAEDVVEVRIYSATNVFNRETYNLQYIKPLKGNKTSIQKIAEERKDWGKDKCQLSI